MKLHAVIWNGRVLRAYNDKDQAEDWIVGEDQVVAPVIVLTLDQWARMVKLAEKHFSTDLYAAGDHNEFWGLVRAAEEEQ